MSTCNRLDLGSTRISAGYAQKSSQILTPNSTFFITEFDYYSSSPLGHTIFFGFDDGYPPPFLSCLGAQVTQLVGIGRVDSSEERAPLCPCATLCPFVSWSVAKEIMEDVLQSQLPAPNPAIGSEYFAKAFNSTWGGLRRK